MSSSKTGEADVLEFQPKDNETVYLTHLPKQIWLQTGSAVCDGIDGDEIDFRHLDSEALTWCTDAIEYGDVKFVRYDIHDTLQEQLKEAQSELSKAARLINCAGPLDHRVQVMKLDYSNQIIALQEQNRKLREGLNQLRAALKDGQL